MKIVTVLMHVHNLHDCIFFNILNVEVYIPHTKVLLIRIVKNVGNQRAITLSKYKDNCCFYLSTK